jgi:hypothetical protein
VAGVEACQSLPKVVGVIAFLALWFALLSCQPKFFLFTSHVFPFVRQHLAFHGKRAEMLRFGG